MHPDTQLAIPWAVIYFIVYVVLIAATYLLTPKPDVEARRPKGLGDFQFPTATEGRPIPVVWGTNRVRAPNVIWYGDLRIERVRDDGVTIGYKYYIGMDMAICFGPINALTEIEVGSGQRQSISFNAADVNTSTNVITTSASHGFGRGDGPHRISTTGVMPGGLNTTTSYWVREVTATTFKLYHSKKDARADTNPVDITTQGTGIHTIRDYGRIAWSGQVGGDSNINGNTLRIDSKKFFGGEGQGGGLFGDLVVYDGLPNQVKDPYLVSQLGQDVPAYVDVAHAVWVRGTATDGRILGLIGERTHIEPWAFTVERYPDNLALTGTNHIVNDGDANPAEVLYEILTNNVWGLGRHPSTINFTSFQSAGNTLFNEGNGFSMVLDRGRRAEEVVADVLHQIDASLYVDTNGQWTLKLARADYTLGSLPLLDDQNILDVSEFTRGSWEATSNDIAIGFLDRTNDFKETFAMGQDIANFNTQGGVKTTATFNMPGVRHPSTARLLANRALRGLAFPHAKASILADRTASSLNPGDVFRFTWPPLGIVQMPMRVSRINRGELLSGKIKIEAMQDVFGIGATIYAEPPDSGWVPPSTEVTAFPTGYARVIDAPYWMGFTDAFVSLDATGEWLLALGARPNNASIGYDYYLDTGTGYGQVGESESPGFTPSALLNANYAENTADVDTSNTLVLKSPTDAGAVIATTAARIETHGSNLLLIDDELLAFESYTYNSGPGTYTLHNVHRGLLDTVPAAHSADARVWIILRDETGAAKPLPGFVAPPDSIGGTAAVNAKLLPETTSGTLDINAASALPFTMTRRSEKPLPVGNFRVTSTVTTGTARFPAIVPTTDITLGWNHRHRQDPLILDQNDGSSALGLDTNVQYEYTWFVLDSGSPVQVLQSTTTGITFNYTRAQQLADNGGNAPQAYRVRLRSKDTSLLIDSRVDVIRDFEVFDVGTKAVDLNGTDEALRSTAATIGIANNWSIAFWVKRQDGDTNQRVLCSIGDPTGANSIHFIRPSGSSTSLLVELRDSAGVLFKARTAAGALTASAWTHVCATFDGTLGGDPLIVYVNGVAQTLTGTDNTGTMTDTSRRISIGSFGDLTSFANERVHSLAIWSDDLSSAEVTAIYNAGNGSDFNLNYNHVGYVSAGADLEQWFRLGEDSSPDADIGKQYALSPTGTHNVMDAHQNVAAADVVTDAP